MGKYGLYLGYDANRILGETNCTLGLEIITRTLSHICQIDHNIFVPPAKQGLVNRDVLKKDNVFRTRSSDVKSFLNEHYPPSQGFGYGFDSSMFECMVKSLYQDGKFKMETFEANFRSFEKIKDPADEVFVHRILSENEGLLKQILMEAQEKVQEISAKNKIPRNDYIMRNSFRYELEEMVE
jgi:hypothetical protein